MPEHDAAVIGAGPAGATAARLLAQWGYSVVVISPERRVPERAETIPPSSRRLFRLLNIHDDIDGALYYPTTGNTVWWGSGTARVEHYGAADGTGYQVPRGDFDRRLLERARRAGAAFLNDAVSSVDLGDGAVLRLRSGTEIRARFAIDASGRSGVLARTGLRVDLTAYRTIAICGTWYSEGNDSHTLIESYRDGWAWSVRTSDTLRFVTVMIDTSATGMARGAGLRAAYLHEIGKTRHIRRGTVSGPVWACDASLYHASSYAGSNYLLAGDAGCFVDPLSSYGVKKAMASAWLAATVVNTCMRDRQRSSMALDYFNAQEQRVYEDQRRQTAAHYRNAAAEPHPFWTRRCETPVEAAFYSEAELAGALDRLRRAPSIRLRRAPSVRMKPLARIEGREIVAGEGLTAPGIPRGVEYLEGVHLWRLAEMAESYSQVPDLYAAYNRACPTVALPNFLSALSVLIAKEVLTSEGMR